MELWAVARSLIRVDGFSRKLGLTLATLTVVAGSGCAPGSVSSCVVAEPRAVVANLSNRSVSVELWDGAQPNPVTPGSSRDIVANRIVPSPPWTLRITDADGRVIYKRTD